MDVVLSVLWKVKVDDVVHIALKVEPASSNVSAHHHWRERGGFLSSCGGEALVALSAYLRRHLAVIVHSVHAALAQRVLNGAAALHCVAEHHEPLLMLPLRRFSSKPIKLVHIARHLEEGVSARLR